MAGRQRRVTAPELVQAAERFARWRRNRVVGERIPETLWNGAVALAGRYGVSRTASTLKVGFYELQRRVATIQKGEQAVSPVTFVECPPAVTASECVIEFEKASGCRMRVQFKGQLPDLVALGRSFWDNR
jgi:hypothetical protein